MDKLNFEIVSPERLVLSESVDEVILPGTEGYLGVLPGHAPLLSSLMPGEVSYRDGKRVRFLAVSGGFVEVLPDKVTILAETCERAEEIDLDRAERSKDRAEKELREAESERFRAASTRLQRAVTRIHVVGRIR
jgi:F-type H+-transporting ATPase subunit epsilon